MEHFTLSTPPEARRAVYDAFFRLTARDLMTSVLDDEDFVPPHLPVEALLERFLVRDHAWVRVAPDSGRRVWSIVLRRDVFRALQPLQDSYTRFSAVRFQSLAQGSADCICCFHEGRVLHSVAPATGCAEVLRIMVSKGALYLPVMDSGELVGEIGSLGVLRAVYRLYQILGTNR